jgi:hypothetical protein
MSIEIGTSMNTKFSGGITMNDYYDNENRNNAEIEYEIRKNHAKKVSTRLLTVIQITVCSIIVITVLFLRISGGKAFTAVKAWYVSNISQTIVPDEKINNVKNKVIELFPASSSQQTVSSQSNSGSQSNTSSQPGTSSQTSKSSQPESGSQQPNDPKQAADSQKLIG